jgi:hypothetical protein
VISPTRPSVERQRLSALDCRLRRAQIVVWNDTLKRPTQRCPVNHVLGSLHWICLQQSLIRDHVDGSASNSFGRAKVEAGRGCDDKVSASVAQSRFFERAADVVGLESDHIPKSRS